MQQNPEENPEENPKNRMFVSLLREMLHLNPQKRITPSEALSHPFITLTKLDDDDEDEDSLMAESEEDVTSVTDLSGDEPTDDGEAADGASDVTAASSDGASVAPLMSSVTENVSAGEPQEEVSACGVESLPTDGDAGDQVTDAATSPANDNESAVTPPPPDGHLGSDGASSPSRNSRSRRIRKFFSRMFRALCCCCCSTGVEQ